MSLWYAVLGGIFGFLLAVFIPVLMIVVPWWGLLTAVVTGLIVPVGMIVVRLGMAS